MRVASPVRERSASHSSSLSGSGWASSDDEADELEFSGGGGSDEDQTVIACSASVHHHPPLPQQASTRGLVLMIPTTMQPQPFPRSSTTSVFSVPDNASIAYTLTNPGSTTTLTRQHQEKD
ncbi:hypothetical protein FB45DRAFT_1035232 [Roridomyces roridus]|uniref:Uncharacterized protein n=1 Tax=Roridomyces roridus TaxID=1738132 RepID=A0AAD7FCS8_9AGAR|nr:hypothetical protein FB45DRAFT_1035232 [Roridomyces roridus]